MIRLPSFGSLQAQLVLRLAAVFVLATVAGVGMLVYQAYQSAHSLSEMELTERATDLARGLSRNSEGTAVLAKPVWLSSSPNSRAMHTLYAIQTPDGTVVAASDPDMAQLAADEARRTPDQFFTLDNFGTQQRDYYGLVLNRPSAIGPVSITVARFMEGDELAEDMFHQFVRRAVWAAPVFAAIILLIVVWTIRRSLRPLLAVSERAAAISPDQTGLRLPIENLPEEIRPLVEAVNRAFDRLEQGFAVQRAFTANAAHELRTPLAILSVGLEALGEEAEIRKLRSDAARMNRLVDQLLRIARLDSVKLDVSAPVDLSRVAQRLVEDMAPFAILMGRRLGLDLPALPVTIVGNEDALYDALRNLVENALHHAPADSEVTVSLSADGELAVADRGPGVLESNRALIFERFWRGRGTMSPGAGLGLSIVTEIATAHGTRVTVSDRLGGGAVFAMGFQPV